MSDSDEDYDSDSAGYDIHDPRTREHNAYKIAQDNAGRATRRYKYGDDVDADGTNIDPDEDDNDDSMERRLQNAREARDWTDRFSLHGEADRRYEWNARWTGGAHDGVEDEADRRMQDVGEWNDVIDDLERRIDHGRDARAHNPDEDSVSSSDEESAGIDDAEYEKNIGDAREARKERYDDDEQEEEQGEESDDDHDEEDEEYGEGEGEEDDEQEQGGTLYHVYERNDDEDDYDDED